MRFLTAFGVLFLMFCVTSPTPVPAGRQDVSGSSTSAPGSSIPYPGAWRSLPKAAEIDDVCAHVSCAPRTIKTGVRVENGRIFNGDKALTPELGAVESFDVSQDRREVVFSARRRDNFDIGLVSLDGSDIHWVPEDRADETDVQWAPRGNKVSFLLRTAAGDLVRTVHIPTATQLTVDFPYARVRKLAWDPPAERYSVVVESPLASQRIETLKYDGEDRRVAVESAVKLDGEVEPFAGGVILRPKAIRYGERLPLAVWIDVDPFAWSDARGALMRTSRLAIVVVPRTPDAAFWSAVGQVSWLDASRAYVVGPNAGEQPATVILADKHVSDDVFVRRGKTLMVAPAVVQSFAAGYIADQLKGQLQPNGR